MRTLAPLAALLSVLAGCSSNDSPPTGLKPEFTGHCTPPRLTVVANPAAITRARNTSGSGKFVVTNGCDVTISGWTASATRTGAVASVGTPNPVNIPTLAPGASFSPVLVPFTTGSSAGTGTVVLTVTNDLGTVSRSASLTVTVSP
jgi:hypothetical protein